MTSTDQSEGPALQEDRGHIPPPVSWNKPLTPFSIQDILNKPSVRRSGAAPLIPPGDKGPPGGHSRADLPLLRHSSPLSALEELTSKTFRGLEVSVLQAAEGRDGVTLFGQRNTPKKRRKSRTAFTNHQIYQLEKRFLYQKYLSPVDRDQIAQQLVLTSAQVITWFQNRRAKLKRDLEEMKADVESAKAVGCTVACDKLSKLAELEECAARGSGGRSILMPGRTNHGQPETTTSLPPGGLHVSEFPASSSKDPDQTKTTCCSEDEDEEIDVDDSKLSAVSEAAVGGVTVGDLNDGFSTLEVPSRFSPPQHPSCPAK